jgi:hypothetical protein
MFDYRFEDLWTIAVNVNLPASAAQTLKGLAPKDRQVFVAHAIVEYMRSAPGEAYLRNALHARGRIYVGFKGEANWLDSYLELHPLVVNLRHLCQSLGLAHEKSSVRGKVVATLRLKGYEYNETTRVWEHQAVNKNASKDFLEALV